jgi:hypothetical protein
VIECVHRADSSSEPTNMSFGNTGNQANHWNSKQAVEFLREAGITELELTSLTGRERIALASSINFRNTRGQTEPTNKQLLSLYLIN